MSRVRTVLLFACGVFLAAGCASTGASVRPAEPALQPPDLARYRHLVLEVTRGEGVTVSDTELERVRARIVETVRVQQAERFQEIGAVAPGDPEIPVLSVTVQLTRYDKGSAVARAMLAGLGQIHIDARVTLKDRARDAVLGEYEVTKTFAWGGIYGATTTIENVEAGFAQGVAALVLGR